MQSIQVDRKLMTACRIARFGGPEVIETQRVARPRPGRGQVMVRVCAAGVGPWDALIRSGRSALVGEDALPVVLGSDLAGVVEAVGEGVAAFHAGDAVFGVTNGQFIGAYAEYAVAEASRLSIKPGALDFVSAAAMPVVAVTAWQMVFEHARLEPGESVLILGGTGSVGGCAVQLARRHGAQVVATTSSGDVAEARRLGADVVVDLRSSDLRQAGVKVDAVIDTTGGALQDSAWPLLKRGGSFVSVVSPPDPSRANAVSARSGFFYVDVDTRRLTIVADLIETGVLTARVGTVLPLEEARRAHEMLDGLIPRASGKTVLTVDSAA